MKVKILVPILMFLFMSGKSYAQFDGKLFQMEGSGGALIQLEFKDTRYVLHTPDQFVYVRGYIKIVADTITFTDLNGPMACKREIEGVYRFKYQNSELKFDVIKDDCAGRVGMASKPWKEIEREKE